MLPHESSVSQDQYGFPIIEVTGENLQNFPALIAWIRQQGYGRDTGLVKLRLAAADRRDGDCVRQITRLMKTAFQEKEYDDETKSLEYVYNPSMQIVHKASPAHHIYQYSKGDCTTQERKVFVEQSVKPNTYRKKRNCCSPYLESLDLNKLRQHIFIDLEKNAAGLQYDEKASTLLLPTTVYGDGIVLNKASKVSICDGFSLSSGLDNLLCHLNEKYDGLACPYYYAGDKHSLFPWHCEDGGLYSINYLFTGAPKYWFGISPDYFGLMDKIASGLRVDLVHSACRALLVDHKVLVADPDYFKEYFQVPYAQVVQEPGDFILTLPFGLHSGFNTGKNLAIAANFADVPWIELGMYAPICTCNALQIHLDLTSIIKEFRPELLDLYQNGSALIFPKTHPREVRYPGELKNPAQENHALLQDPVKVDLHSLQKQRVGPRKKVKSEFCVRNRILYCPECNQPFTGNKYNRLKEHIEKHHSDSKEENMRTVAIRYPAWRPKMTKGLTCQICNHFIRGDKTNMKTHIACKHRL